MAGDDDRDRRPRLTIVPPPAPDRFVPSGNSQQVYDPAGPSMLDIVMGAAQAAWRQAVQPDGTVNVDVAAKAAFLAKEALPYTNPKLAAIVVKNVDESAAAEERAVKSDADAVRRKLEQMISRKAVS